MSEEATVREALTRIDKERRYLLDEHPSGCLCDRCKLFAAWEAALRQPTGEGQTGLLERLYTLLSDSALTVVAPDKEWASKWADATHDLYELMNNPQAGATGQPTTFEQELQTFDTAMQREHGIDLRAATPATVAAGKPALGQQSDLAAQLAVLEARVEEARWWFKFAYWMER